MSQDQRPTMFSFEPRANLTAPPPKEPSAPQPRVDIQVGFDDKDSARECGAKWDADRKTWYAQTPYALLSLTDVPPAGPKRLWVHVPFEARKRARAMGAEWDAAAKCWYATAPVTFDELIHEGVASTPNQQYMQHVRAFMAAAQ